jgi:cardiolipin synthase A/B
MLRPTFRKNSHSALEQALPAKAEVRLVRGGTDYFDQLEQIITSANRELHLQTYIFDEDETGQSVIAALKAAAARDVRVFVMLDAFGGSLSRTTIQGLEAAGVHIRVFAPWLSWHSLHLGRRLHHKIVVADGAVALIGGINIANKYRGSQSAVAWLDYAVRIESAEIAQPLADLCQALFAKRHYFRRPQITAPAQEAGSAVTILVNDWLLKRNEIYRAYRRQIRNASREIIIVGTYFLPGRRLTYALKRAAKRGVRVQLILSGITDVPILRRATLYLYRQLLQRNLLLYEWPHSVLHGKAAVVDGAWTTIGSFNLNQLSTYGSIEMNVELHSADFAAIATAAFRKVIDECVPITLETLHMREGKLQQLFNWAAYHIVRTSLLLLPFTSYKRIWNLTEDTKNEES